jgi:hypothetical protein
MEAYYENDFKRNSFRVMGWAHVTLKVDQWWVVVNTIINISIPKNVVELLDS